MPDLLLEIGAEEIPASYIVPALHALREKVDNLLVEARIAYDGAASIRTLATPRRLTLHVPGLAEKQEPITFDVSGPPQRAAYDKAGKPTKALTGFCGSQEVELDAVKIVETKKGPYCVVTKTDAGRTTTELLAEALPSLIVSLPFPKSMHWADRGITFARPIRSLVAMLGSKRIPFAVGEVTAGQQVQGHPFLAPGPITLNNADLDPYTKSLKKAFVMVDDNERRDQLREKITLILNKHGSGEIDDALLDEVTFMVEWPGVIEGRFDKMFLDLPEEVLIESMRYHQKYFPVRTADGKLAEVFIAVHNRTEKQDDAIRIGSERVLKARLDDAKFFWDNDRRTPLEHLAEQLHRVEYLPNLGSVGDKAQRMSRLAGQWSPVIPAEGYKGDAQSHADEAARLCKADLLTEMVGEFPRLQGTMGAFYALEQKKDPEVVLAIAEHYLPRHAEDPLPKTRLGVALSLADKIDHLAACFALGLKPSGSSDPLAVRRNALGVIRIFRKQALTVGLGEWVGAALELIREKVEFNLPAVRDDAVAFLMDRFEDQYLRDGGHREIFIACRYSGSDCPADLEARFEALTQLVNEPHWPSLQELVERTINISKPGPGDGEAWVEEALLEQDEERAVWQAYESCKATVREQFANHHYAEAAATYEAALAEPVHWFFEKVFVNVEDEPVRTNRINLLKNIALLFAVPLANPAAIHVPEESKPNRGKSTS